VGREGGFAVRGFPIGCVIASFALLACNSGSLGSVQGHEVSATHAVFLSVDSTEEFILEISDLQNPCEIFGSWSDVSGASAAVLWVVVENWTGSSAGPSVPGAYNDVSASGFLVPGLNSYSYFSSGSMQCRGRTYTPATSGTVRLKSFGGFQPGQHVVADIDLTFGNDRLAGRVDAVYCGVAVRQCIGSF
jgi:hypothetical protein